MKEQGRERQSREVSLFWIREAWLENRATIILIAGDALCFVFLMTVISVGHYYISWMPLQQKSRLVLEEVHFWITILAWVWLSMTALAEMVISSLIRIGLRLLDYKRLGGPRNRQGYFEGTDADVGWDGADEDPSEQHGRGTERRVASFRSGRKP